MDQFEIDPHQSVKRDDTGGGLDIGVGTVETKPTPQKRDLTGASGSESGQLIGDLLGDISFATGFSAVPNEPSGEGNTHVFSTNLSELAHDFDHFKEFTPASPRLDQVSPPRSPFVELDKASLNDDHFSTMAPSAPPAVNNGAKHDLDIFNTHAQSLLSEFDVKPLEQGSVQQSSHEVGANFSDTKIFGGDHGFVDVKPETQRYSSTFEMLTTLDDIQPPDFYESGDSSMSKEVGGGNKSATDSQVLEPDDLEEYLPKDPVQSELAKAASPPPAPADDLPKPPELQPHTAATNLLEEEAISEFMSEACLTSDLDRSKAMDFDMFEDKVETEEGKVSPYNFYIKEPMLIPEESILFDQNSPSSPGSNQETLFDQFDDPDKLVSTEPSSPRATAKVDDDQLRQFEAKHAELTNFLQERDPSLIEGDEYDRSEDSVSPNPQILIKSLPKDTNNQDDYGFDDENEFERVSSEPVMAATKVEPNESRAFPSKQTTSFEHVKIEEMESPVSVDDYDFAVIPPKVPPHRYPLDEPSKAPNDKKVESLLGSSVTEEPATSATPQVPPTSRDLYDVGEAIGFSPTPPPSASELEQKAAAQKKAEEEELIPFLPKGSFETIPPIYQGSDEVSAQVTSSVKKSSPKSEVMRKVHSGDELQISEEAQQILNIFNPKAWFDPSKLHPKVSELVYWRDPKKSGIVFGGIFLVLIALTCLSFISVVAYTSLAILSGTFAFRVYKNVVNTIQKTDEGHPFKEYLEQDLSLENDKSQEIYTAVIAHVNKLAIKLRHLFLVEDLVDSAKFGAFLYFLTYIGSWFNGLTIIILAFITLFGLPKVYEMNKTVIDQYMDLACAKISEINAKVHEALPFGKKEKAQ